MAEREDYLGSGVASLIGDAGISLDGQSVQLPEDGGFDMQDDISSINESSYYRGIGPPQIKIVGTVQDVEEGNAASTSSPQKDGKAGTEHDNTMSTAVPLSVTESQKKAPNMKNTSKLSIDGKLQKGWCPRWVSDAPSWLKCVIVFSIAMLIGACALVTVALTTALAEVEGGDSSSALSTNSDESNSDFNSDTAPSYHVVFSSPAPTPLRSSVVADPDYTDPTPAPTKQSETGTSTVTSNTTGNEANATPENEDATETFGTATDATDNTPYDPFVTTFFVTGGRFTNDALALVPEQLKTLPVRGGTSFMVHLGDWNSPYSTRCDRQSYEDVSDLFSNSSIPVYFIPGDNDFNDCPDPEQAMSLWHEHLLGYETKHWSAPSQWTIDRAAQENYPENFAFVYNEILFVGINLVGGVVHNTTEWEERQAANLLWIEENYQRQKQFIKAFMLFAHADPDVPSNSPFYEPFMQRVELEYNQIPVVLIHRNLGVEPWSWETEFNNIGNFSVVVVAGSVWPPLMGAVDFRQEDPFIFDQSNWYNEYIEHEASGGAGDGSQP